jgi:hypothetical protein
MGKYSWSLAKTFEFLNSRRPDFEIKSGFIRQLQLFEGRRFRDLKPTSHWGELSEAEHISSEELMLRNTFLNSQALPISDVDTTQYSQNATALKWADQVAGQLEDHPHPASKNPVEAGFAVLKSCLKGGRKECIKAPLGSKRSRPALKPENLYMTTLQTPAQQAETLQILTSPRADKRPSEVKRPASVDPRENTRPNEDKKARLLGPFSPVKITKLLVREGQSITTKGPIRLVNDGIRPATDSKAVLKKKRPTTAQSMRPPSPITRARPSTTTTFTQKYTRPQWR